MVIAGVDWAKANADAIEAANMSLGGGNSQTLKDTIQNSVAAGVAYAVAAGNSCADAKDSSPANSPDALTISAPAGNDGWDDGDDPDNFKEPLLDVSTFVPTLVATGGGGGSDPDTTPPSEPKNLTATAGDSQVTLNWDDNTESDLASYKVYPRTTSGS